MRWFRRCKHETVRCLHGDEIWATMRPWRRPEIARVRCVYCERALYKVEMPDICTRTGTSHYVKRRNW